MSATSTTFGKPSFLISDILKQNNTTIVCRKNSSPEISQMSQSSGNVSKPERKESLQYGCEKNFCKNQCSSEYFSIDDHDNNVHYMKGDYYNYPLVQQSSVDIKRLPDVLSIAGTFNYISCDKLLPCLVSHKNILKFEKSN